MLLMGCALGLQSHAAGAQAVGQPPATDALAAFAKLDSVLQSPRCLNCHPRGDRPSQGDDRHIHLMNVQRGPQNHGMPAMQCSTCHQVHPNEVVGVPGAPHWQLAPISMGWVGLSSGELCRTLLDRGKNGGRSVADLVTHMSTDPLVHSAWDELPHRTAPPLTFDDFKAVVVLWAAAGAPCPQ
jgi:hypothetical protein